MNLSVFIKERYGDAGDDFKVKVSMLREWGLALAADGFRKQTLVDYIGTAKDFFSETDRFAVEERFEAKLSRTYRLCKLAAGK